MNYETEHITEEIKASRERKGLSQRELSAKSGVPQAQISRFERGAVDLRLSSLIALARALDLELSLVPRKAVPAVRSVVQSTRPSRTYTDTAMSAHREIERMQKTLATLKLPDADFPELANLQANLRTLSAIRTPTLELETLKRLSKTIEAMKRTSFDMEKLSNIAIKIQGMRNLAAHVVGDYERPALPKPAYSLDEEEDDA